MEIRNDKAIVASVNSIFKCVYRALNRLMYSLFFFETKQTANCLYDLFVLMYGIVWNRSAL